MAAPTWKPIAFSLALRGDPHGGLDLREAQPDGGRRIGRHLQRIVLGIGNVGLVCGLAPRAQLRLREGQLDRVQPAHHVGELGRGHAGGVTDALRAGHIDVDQPVCELAAIQCHGVGRYAEVKVVACDERVDQVEIGGQSAIKLTTSPSVKRSVGVGSKGLLAAQNPLSGSSAASRSRRKGRLTQAS